MNYKYGAYLIIPFKYSGEFASVCAGLDALQMYKLETMDINESVKNMFNGAQERSIGEVYKIGKKTLVSHLCEEGDYSCCQVEEQTDTYSFDLLDSYLYVFNTKIAFLCLGLSFRQMDALRMICNPGYVVNPAKFYLFTDDGEKREFSMDQWLLGMCGNWQFERFYDSKASVLLEAYTYILALGDTLYPSLEDLRRVTFNLHQMQSPNVLVEDDSEGDIRYAYAVKNTALNGYRWGCCVTSQTTAYAFADISEHPDLEQEMQIQAQDGLPITLLALYEKYTCLRFTQLIADLKPRKLKDIIELKRMMLNFQAFGTVSPANLSRWNNVKQIYAYLLEVSETDAAVQDISTKIDILVAQQQELETVRSTRIMNLITVFGIVGIMASVQEIVQILSDASGLMWNVTLLTVAVLALCFGIAMRKK